MKVLHVATAFPRHEGDVVTPWLLRLLQALRREGVEAEVMAPAYRGGSSGRLDDVPVHRFRYAPARLETLTHDETVPERLARRPGYAALVPPYLAAGWLAGLGHGRRRPDVVHVHWPVPHAIFGAAVRRGSRGYTRMVSSYYSVELNWVDRRHPWLRPFLRWSLRTADIVTAISSSTAGRIRDFVERPISVVPFGAAVEPAEETETHPPFAHHGPLELLFVGRLVERKGVEHLVRALPFVQRERPARLTIVGEGAWEGRIREAVRACGVGRDVRFTGYLSRDALRRHYASCDVFVLPAVVDRKGDTEGLGVVLLEALRFARPVVATRVGGIPDIVKPGRTGRLVPPGDEEALARAVLELADQPERARQLGERGRAWAADRFTWPRVVEQLVEVYEAAVASRPADRR